jgi:Tol biopolymer transport system component
MRFFRLYFLHLFILLLISTGSFGQYFGQNKVNYEKFPFMKKHTDHFTIYNYLQNDTMVQRLSNQAEKWYLRHNAIFGDTISSNPLIFYNDKADFKQTNVISGNIGVGTGGVTEGFKRRVIMPMMNSNKETNHVLGHELVHVFQYYMFQSSDSLSYQNLQNIPLWMIEGLAEYLSIGVQDNQTAMWMRDAVMHDNVPSIKDMTRRPDKYFPYRYGHAFWAFITGTWGDAIIRPFFYHTARFGMEKASKNLFNIELDSLSKRWQHAVKSTHEPFTGDTLTPQGKQIFSKDDFGTLNLAPVISPDGEHITFLSNKNVISIDMLMAKVKTGEVVKKLTGPVSQSHIDDFNYIESAGSWSPDGKRYVVTSFTKGRNNLIIISLKNRVRVEREIRIEGIQSFDNPEWSPNGRYIVFSGLVDGYSDLYLYDLERDTTTKLTSDPYSDLQPAWSSDSKKIIFISDRGPETDFDRQEFSPYRLSEYSLERKKVNVYQDIFPQSEVFSPYYANNDSSVYFLSHADGYRNLYKYKIHEDSLFRLTDLQTGISGITELAPSFSISNVTDQVAYTLYRDNGYHIYLADMEDFEEEPVSKTMHDDSPELLPPKDRMVNNIVQHNLKNHPQTVDSTITQMPYNARLQLEYIGSSGIGVSTGYYDTYASGGVNAIFGDILKRHQFYTMLMMQGEIYDIGGGATYINRESRFNWGGSFYHIPYRYSYYRLNNSIYDANSVDSLTIVNQRIFQDRFSVFGQYPFSKKLRIETGGYFTRYGYRVDLIKNFYVNGLFADSKKERGEAPDPMWIQKIYTAFVGDDVDFGVTSPLDGYRFRIQLDQSFTDIRQLTSLVDLRRYLFKKPLSFGARLFHYARYGVDANALYPLYLGDNYFIRGYSYSSFDQNYSVTGSSFNPNSIAGSKMALFNAEVRLPFTGPERLAVIKSGYLFSDLVLFADGGFATDNYNNINWSWDPALPTEDNADVSNVVFSAGLAWRINLFGYAVLEPYIAKPFQRTDKDWVFGLFIKGMDW